MVTHWRKQQHYFIARLSQDLFGDWVLVRSWGNVHNNLGGCTQDVIQCEHEALKRFQTVNKRQHRRGYIEISPASQKASKATENQEACD